MADTSTTTKHRQEKLCQITSGAVSSIAPIAKIAFGDGGVDLNGDPVAPSATATALVNELARYDIDSVTYPTSTTARYTVTIPSGDLIGAEISEAAIVDSNGALDAIKTMYKKKKDAGVSFTFTFDDDFTGG